MSNDPGGLPAQAAEAATADLARLGYCVLEGVLTGAELAALRARTDLIASHEAAESTAWYSHGNQRIFMLLNRGAEFVRLAGHRAVLAVAERVLGPDLLLSSITANITRPGNEQQQLHADQQYVDEPWLCPMTVQAVWMLDDFTIENGATRIVPGSHLQGTAPTGSAQASAHLLGTAGSVGFIDGRVWHGTDVNTTADQQRRGIFAYYCAPYLRQQENVFRSLHSEVRHRLSPRMRKLLGYDIWYGLGTVDGLPREWLGTSQRSGPTNADDTFPR